MRIQNAREVWRNGFRSQHRIRDLVLQKAQILFSQKWLVITKNTHTVPAIAGAIALNRDITVTDSPFAAPLWS